MLKSLTVTVEDEQSPNDESRHDFAFLDHPFFAVRRRSAYTGDYSYFVYEKTAEGRTLKSGPLMRIGEVIALVEVLKEEAE